MDRTTPPTPADNLRLKGRQRSDSALNTTEFLDELSRLVWPSDSDTADFAPEGDNKGCLSATYVLEPFRVSKTIDYEVNVCPNELRASCQHQGTH